ncbi:MAG: hypothetical protein Tsb0016_23920 [Sphingomonadales bacterium]
MAACDPFEADPAAPAPLRLSACQALTVLDESGRPLVGIEDIAIDPERGLAYLAAYDRRQPLDLTAADTGRFLGGIHALTLAALDQAAARPLTAQNILPATLGQGRTRPHGVELLIEADGSRFLYAVDRFGGEANILALALAEDGLTSQIATPPRTNGHVCHPNNIAAMDRDQLYVSNDRAACGTVGVMMENVLGLKRSFVGYFHDDAFSVAVADLFFANGLEIDDHGDGQQDLAVAETRAGHISFYPIIDRASGELGPMRARIPIGAGPDNLAEGEDGAIYAAAIPNLFRYALFRAFGAWAARPDSDIVRLWRSPADGQIRWARLARVSGKTFAGATVAVQAGPHLLLGSAFGAGIGLCRLHDAAAS